MILGVGVYIFMLQRVSIGILKFFATYFWHFLGYAIAFHIVMYDISKDGGAFLSLADSMIKVRIKESTEIAIEKKFADY